MAEEAQAGDIARLTRERDEALALGNRLTQLTEALEHQRDEALAALKRGSAAVDKPGGGPPAAMELDLMKLAKIMADYGRRLDALEGKK